MSLMSSPARRWRWRPSDGSTATKPSGCCSTGSSLRGRRPPPGAGAGVTGGEMTSNTACRDCVPSLPDGAAFHRARQSVGEPVRGVVAQQPRPRRAAQRRGVQLLAEAKVMVEDFLAGLQPQQAAPSTRDDDPRRRQTGWETAHEAAPAAPNSTAATRRLRSTLSQHACSLQILPPRRLGTQVRADEWGAGRPPQSTSWTTSSGAALIWRAVCRGSPAELKRNPRSGSDLVRGR